jgi:hypothetical protein
MMSDGIPNSYPKTLIDVMLSWPTTNKLAFDREEGASPGSEVNMMSYVSCIRRVPNYERAETFTEGVMHLRMFWSLRK